MPEIDRALDRETPEAVRLRPRPAKASGGCQLGGGAGGGALLGLVALAWAVARRRR